jgi:hypothetical protein
MIHTKPEILTVGSANDVLHLPRPIQPNRNARSVYLITSKDGGVLFDLDRDEFFKLDPIATKMWTLIAGGSDEEHIAGIIAQECGVDRRRVAGDLVNLLRSAAALGITPDCVQHKTEAPHTDAQGPHPTCPWYGQDPNAPLPKPTRFAVFRAFLALALFDLVLSIKSLKSLCRLVSKWLVASRSQPHDSEMISATCRAVERACVWYPKKAVCLQRSAVTTCLLRSLGFRAAMVVAARVMPMQAHAWVEVDGAVVNDHIKVRSLYAPLASF